MEEISQQKAIEIASIHSEYESKLKDVTLFIKYFLNY